VNDPAKPFGAVAWVRAKREELGEKIRRVGWGDADLRMLDRLQGDPLCVGLKGRIIAPAMLRSLAVKQGLEPQGIQQTD